MFRIEMLPAEQGDCLWIEYGNGRDPARRVLIDAGPPGTYKTLKKKILDLAPADRHFELFIVTHIDSDHIGGALKLVEDKRLGVTYGDVWFNGYQHLIDELGAVQGERLSQALEDLPWNRAFNGRAVVVPWRGRLPRKELPGGLALTLLSPTRAELARLLPVWEREARRAGLVPGARPARKVEVEEEEEDVLGEETMDIAALAARPFKSDAAEANSTSIAVLAEYEGKRLLLGADAYAPVMEASLRRLAASSGEERVELAAFKVAHHGSRANMSNELLAAVSCRRYLISTNGKIFRHPNPETIARILLHGGRSPELYFNYRTTYNEVWDRADLKRVYRYETHYPDGEGITIDL